ncbi:hypothetical protein M758_UG335300 [Ceratodon purpureus]|nr:hypothetical protein M758_UG335300 [Ceratodon purpureus]
MVCISFCTHCSCILRVSGAWVGRCAGSLACGRLNPGLYRGSGIAVWNSHTPRQLGIQARGFRLVPRMSGEVATELSSGVALPPPDDEFVSGSSNEVTKQWGEAGATLSGRYDSYEGMIVDPRSLPSDGSTFKKSLMASIAQWRRERKHGIWLKLPIENVNLVEAAVAAGFRYHHAEPAYLMLTLWLPDGPCTLPRNASHQVDVGAFVLNDKNEILAVQEKNGPLKGTGVWKMPTGLTNQGEDIFDGAIREVKEETGVDARFLEVVGFRQGHQVAFDKSDLFFLCILRPTSTEIVAQESEIAAAKWMPISEFRAQPIFNQRPTMLKMLEICLARVEGRCKGFGFDPIHPDSPNPNSYFYYNQVDFAGEQGQTKL